MSIGDITTQMILDAIDRIGPDRAEVSTALGMNYKTLVSRIVRNKELQDAFNKSREKMIDQAEGIIKKSLDNGDLKTAKFVVARLGKDRGWTTREELSGPNGEPLTHKLEGLDDAELLHKLEGLSEAVRNLQDQ